MTTDPQPPSANESPNTPAATPRGAVMLGYVTFAIGMLAYTAAKMGGPVLGSLLVLVVLAGAGIVFSKRKDMIGTIYESHATWLTRTVVIAAGFIVVGAGLLMIGIGLGDLVLLLGSFYYMYRTVKGFFTFSKAKPIDNPVGLI